MQSAENAIGLVTEDGVEFLLHIGINTVELKGKHFEAHIRPGGKMKKGLPSASSPPTPMGSFLCTCSKLFPNNMAVKGLIFYGVSFTMEHRTFSP